MTFWLILQTKPPFFLNFKLHFLKFCPIATPLTACPSVQFSLRGSPRKASKSPSRRTSREGTIVRAVDKKAGTKSGKQNSDA